MHALRLTRDGLRAVNAASPGLVYTLSAAALTINLGSNGLELPGDWNWRLPR